MEYSKAISYIDAKKIECLCRFEVATSKAENKRVSEAFEFLNCARDAIERLMTETLEEVNGVFRCRRFGSQVSSSTKYCSECGQRLEGF